MNKIEEKAAELEAELKKELGEIELAVIGNYTLADAIREGCMVTDQAYEWGNGDTACALSAAVIAAQARGYMK
jgi:hypothetical protein